MAYCMAYGILDEPVYRPRYIPSSFGHFYWSIHHEIFTQCKGQQAFSEGVKKRKKERKMSKIELLSYH